MMLDFDLEGKLTVIEEGLQRPEQSLLPARIRMQAVQYEKLFCIRATKM